MMVYGEIHIGECDKVQIIKDYVTAHDISKIYILGTPIEIDTDIECECIKFSDLIRYKYYYHLLQEVNMNSLVVINECLKRQNRGELTYNCIRKYIIQTHHRIVFNYYPIIKQKEDFMILYDMISPTPFMKEPYKYVTHFEGVNTHPFKFEITSDEIELPIDEYEAEKEKIIAQVNKDADIIPRRLLKWTESQKPKGYDRLDKIKPRMHVCISNLKVDQYYYKELMRFKEELENVTEDLQR